jgi:predicted Zn-dependent peptidase
MYNKLTLPNGVRIVYETIPYVRSASVGIWVNTGSRDEAPNENGAAHFIEHMVFKGTETRSAQELALTMDRMGGQVNAFTTKEHTCFHGRVLDTQIRQLGDVLCDMLLSSKFDENDVNNERNVIIEEIGMYEDTPDDLVTENLFAECFRGSSLARPVLGTPDTLGDMDGRFLKNYMRDHYTGNRIIVAMSGNVSEADIEYYAGKLKNVPAGDKTGRARASYIPGVSVKEKPTEQNHLVLAFPGIPVADDRRFTAQLLSGIFGGEMSSRLFQSVREDNGLCYSIFSFGSTYEDTGLFGIYTALSRETERPALELICDEIKKLKKYGVTRDELERAREQVKANLLMSLESTNARMNRLGYNELYFDRYRTVDETIAAYDRVTAEDIAGMAETVFDFGRVSFSAVGKVDDPGGYKGLLGRLL